MRAKNEFKFIAEAYQRVHKEGTDKRFRLVGVGGMHSQTENVEGEFDTIDELIDSIDLPEEYGNEWVEEIKDPSNWSSEGFEDNLLRFGIGEIYEVVDLDGEVDEFNREENRKDLAKPIHSWMKKEDNEKRESSYDIEKRLGGGRFDHPGKTYRSGSPRVRLTLDSPGTASVHLPEGDPRIQKYLDLGYKIVKDYKKAEQSER